MSKPFRLAIVGSTLLGRSKEAQAIIDEVIHRLRPNMIVSGEGPGIDQLAKHTAKRLNLAYQPYPPKIHKWLRGSPDGFQARNIRIARNCDYLVRIGAKDGVTYGSGWTHDYAKAMGIPCENYEI